MEKKFPQITEILLATPFINFRGSRSLREKCKNYVPQNLALYSIHMIFTIIITAAMAGSIKANQETVEK